MSAPSLLDLTRARFPAWTSEAIAVTPLEKGGSDRKFYRIGSGEKSLIVVKYGDQRAENRHYVAVAHFLKSGGVRVPEIYQHDEDERLIWMQDLGEIDLWAFRDASWETRRARYQSAIEQARALHELPNPAAVALQPEFDEKLYLWEQNYFFENCLRGHFGLQASLEEHEIFSEIARHLAQLPRVLVHRDFQSQNIMIREEAAWLIDFQGMRRGLREYDLASLLYDPYVDLTTAERSELLDYYQSASGLAEADFRRTFDLCALQRLMQALGAYGFLGHVKNKPDFLRHIPKALGSLRDVAGRIDGLGAFVRTLDAVLRDG